LAFLATQPDAFPAGVGKALALANIGVRLSPKNLQSVDGATAEEVHSEQHVLVSPDERIADAMNEIRQSVVAELRELLLQVDALRFENIVLDVLHAMGYGARRSDLLRVGASGDGGIDGIISLDKLGLEKVYVQAKRWQANVGAPDVQGFYGALAGRRATKGVFITTSGFTRQALDFAASVDKIVLVDGAKLAELMIDHDVGVSNRSLRVPRVDGDYFE
jgi:restriction system protein